MARMTPQEYAEKWRSRLSGSLTDIQRGVGRVTVSPMELAANKQDKWLAGIQAAAQNGKWAAGLRRVSLQEWKDQFINKGIPRISGGAEAAKGKMQTFAEELLPYVDNLAQTVNAMPDLSIEDSVNRAAAWIRGMSQFRRSR